MTVVNISPAHVYIQKSLKTIMI